MIIVYLYLLVSEFFLTLTFLGIILALIIKHLPHILVLQCQMLNPSLLGGLASPVHPDTAPLLPLQTARPTGSGGRRTRGHGAQAAGERVWLLMAQVDLHCEGL